MCCFLIMFYCLTVCVYLFFLARIIIIVFLYVYAALRILFSFFVLYNAPPLYLHPVPPCLCFFSLSVALSHICSFCIRVFFYTFLCYVTVSLCCFFCFFFLKLPRPPVASPSPSTFLFLSSRPLYRPTSVSLLPSSFWLPPVGVHP